MQSAVPDAMVKAEYVQGRERDGRKQEQLNREVATLAHDVRAACFPDEDSDSDDDDSDGVSHAGDGGAAAREVHASPSATPENLLMASALYEEATSRRSAGWRPTRDKRLNWALRQSASGARACCARAHGVCVRSCWRQSGRWGCLRRGTGTCKRGHMLAHDSSNTCHTGDRLSALAQRDRNVALEL
jgi:hypothetical protein